jgi:hypothetical protein
MADYAIVQREFFKTSGGGAITTPLVVKNLGRFKNVAFQATTITKVEAALDDTTFLDITSLGTTTVTGLWFIKDVAFPTYRVTGTGTLTVTAN